MRPPGRRRGGKKLLSRRRRAHYPDRLRTIPQPAAAEALKLLYAAAGGAQPGLSRAHLELDVEPCGPGRGGEASIFPAACVSVLWGPHAGSAVAPSRARIRSARRPKLRREACGDRQAAHLRPGLRLHVGFRRPGCACATGGRGTRKVQDIFVDARVPREERDGWPLVFAGDQLAWIRGSRSIPTL